MGPSHTLQDNVASLVQPHKCPLQYPYYCDNKASQWISKFPLSSSNTLVENHCLRDLERKGILSTFSSPSFLYTLVVIWQEGAEVTPLVAGLQLLHVAPCCWPILLVTCSESLGRVCHCPPGVEPFTPNFEELLCDWRTTILGWFPTPLPPQWWLHTKSSPVLSPWEVCCPYLLSPLKSHFWDHSIPFLPSALSPAQGVHASEVNRRLRLGNQMPVWLFLQFLKQFFWEPPLLTSKRRNYLNTVLQFITEWLAYWA